MFKKRTRPTAVREKSRVEEGAGIDEGGEASGSGAPAEGEEDETGRTIEDLVLLRKLRKSQAQLGIDLVKLNRGEEKKGKNKKKELDASEKFGLQAGQGRGGGDDKDDELDDEKEKAKRLVRTNNFTQQTNALDVDKHMMAYIESELAKKRGETGATDESKKKEAFDPQAELYEIAERYKLIQSDFESKKAKKEDDEGNVTNSLGMLTSIPEVDLGMDNRLRNIELTEKAKREMLEHRKQAALDAAERERQKDDYAAARFFRPNQRVASDIYAIQEAKRAGAGLAPRTENATDEAVYERFKKRSVVLACCVHVLWN
ncbi:uncharacterized protein IL334_004209 [Kwoniella shivajii]|uniref:Nuclear speckle splicing regulatory protein 1 N-terminal domain-containing protein n=1 Tax=Kwoniella shivajii TaxID=564305 RepID=A0ABZ1D3R3_9TREE|nr:hypothetical protein IL334_004209 [Kwoniella shivajii]